MLQYNSGGQGPPLLEALCSRFVERCFKLFVDDRRARWALTPSQLVAQIKLAQIKQVEVKHSRPIVAIDPLPLAVAGPQVILGDVDPAHQTQLLEAFTGAVGTGAANGVAADGVAADGAAAEAAAGAADGAAALAAGASTTAGATGVQVDLDDAACPSWTNICNAHDNIKSYVHGSAFKKENPVMYFRPRSWNLLEPNVTWNGQPIFGALYDFGVHMANNAATLYEANNVIALFLPKLESAAEAELWDEIFTFTEEYCHLPRGAIRACVVVESFPLIAELDQVLDALCHHSLGLNCGVWDYVASIAFRLAKNGEVLFNLPSQISPETAFIVAYRRAVLAAAIRHKAPCTAGMVALIPPPGCLDVTGWATATAWTSQADHIKEGFSGCLTYSSVLCGPLRSIYTSSAVKVSPISVTPTVDELIACSRKSDTVPQCKAHHYIDMIAALHAAWRQGYGHFIFDCVAYDSATVEICRARLINQLKKGDIKIDYEKSRTIQVVGGASIEVTLSDYKKAAQLFKETPPPRFLTDWLYLALFSQ